MSPAFVYRALILKDRERVEIRSRKNKHLTTVYPGIAAAGLRVKADLAVIDGEIVALDAQGSPSFQALQQHIRYSLRQTAKDGAGWGHGPDAHRPEHRRRPATSFWSTGSRPAVLDDDGRVVDLLSGEEVEWPSIAN